MDRQEIPNCCHKHDVLPMQKPIMYFKYLYSILPVTFNGCYNNKMIF